MRFVGEWRSRSGRVVGCGSVKEKRLLVRMVLEGEAAAMKGVRVFVNYQSGYKEERRVEIKQNRKTKGCSFSVDIYCSC